MCPTCRYDNDKSLTFNTGDQPASTQISLKFPNGTTYLTTTTDANGNFSFNPTVLQASPGTVFSVVRVSDGKSLGSVTTDSLGNGHQDIPIPPVGTLPVITGFVFFGM